MRIITILLLLATYSCTPKLAEVNKNNPASPFYLPDKEFFFFENGEWVKGTPDEEAETANYKPFLMALFSNLKYPAEARESWTQGTVLIEVTQDETGQILDANIKRDLANGCGEAALTAFQKVSKNNKLPPIYKNGIPQKVKHLMPLNFKLH